MSTSVSEQLLTALCAILTGAGLDPVYPRRLSSVDGREGCVCTLGGEVELTRYIDGSALVERTVRVWCKRRSASAAMSDAEDAAAALDGATVSAGGVGAVVDVDGTPEEVALDESGFRTWQVDATIAYLRD